MPQYACKFVTDDGSIVETIVEAESKFEIYESAEARNEMVLSVKKYKPPFNLQEWFSRRQQVKPEDLENFTAQLAIMLSSGVPLLSCLEALTEQAGSDSMRKVLDGLIASINSGQSLSQAMANYPGVFDTMYVNMVKAGESAGVLEQILTRLSEFIEHDLEIRRNIKKAMRYPIIVLSALAAAFTGAVVFIIPKFAKLFIAQGVELPLPTRIMIGLSNIVVNYWWLIIICMVALIAGLISFARTPKGAYFFDLVKLKTPIFKEIFLKSAISRFSHMLETLTRAGIQIIKALETTEATVGNLVIAQDIGRARVEVEQGISLADALRKSPWFPSMTIRMISVGEQSGNMEAMLANIAKQFDEAVDTKIARLSASIEPIMTVAMGGLLLLIALGIFLPMWNMYAAIK
jgi:type II secretory pathway component PulF